MSLLKYETKTIVVIDHAATSKAARAIREKAGLSVREVARRMGFSAAYISDLELGKRHWSRSKSILFERAVKFPEDQP